MQQAGKGGAGTGCHGNDIRPHGHAVVDHIGNPCRAITARLAGTALTNHPGTVLLRQLPAVIRLITAGIFFTIGKMNMHAHRPQIGQRWRDRLRRITTHHTDGGKAKPTAGSGQRMQVVGVHATKAQY